MSAPVLSRLAWQWPLLLAVAGGLATNVRDPPVVAANDGPRVLDARVGLALVAEAPLIATPIGVAVDPRGRPFVLESHTHIQPQDYAGPSADRIKILHDHDGDGRADEATVFASGFDDGMNLAFAASAREGDAPPARLPPLYLVTAKAVWRLVDTDGDDVADERAAILSLVEPASVYAHAALLGLAVHDGWLYVSRGNTGGAAWVLEGSDRRRLTGYGDGGNVVRVRPDGSELEEVATGFWNPFALVVDTDGRLFTADNDPDSRGPNRLVHVVPGGDYGYKSLHGGSGIHPFLAWNGELPGTLPFAAALGEAPAGLLDVTGTALPAEFAGSLLCAIWEESRIVRLAVAARGASVEASPTTLVEGGPDFRPVAFAAGPDGTVVITDWVRRVYPNHGQGRVWRLTSSHATRVPAPSPTTAPRTRADVADAVTALRDRDPFIRHQAVMLLARPAHRALARQALTSADADVRLGALLALRRSAADDDAAALLRPLLADADVRVRRMALVWMGEAGLSSLLPDAATALAGVGMAEALLPTYLEAVRFAQPAFLAAHRARSARLSKDLPRPLPVGLLEGLAFEDIQPPAVRRAAVALLTDVAAVAPRVVALAVDVDAPVEVRREAVRALAMAPDATTQGPALLSLARDTREAAALRADALSALAHTGAVGVADLLPLLADPEADVRLETARLLRLHELDAAAKAAVERARQTASDTAERDQLSLALGDDVVRPGSDDAWQGLLRAGGNAARGRRVFQSPSATCSNCHAMGGRGGTVGPALDGVGASKTRAALATAILDPSAEISPEWTTWFVRVRSGETHLGRQIDVRDQDILLHVERSPSARFALTDVEAYGLSGTSLMPDGLERQLTTDDVRDLLAYLTAGTGEEP